MADKIICEYLDCERPGTQHVKVSLPDGNIETRLCKPHLKALRSTLLSEWEMAPAKQLSAITDWKVRRGYVARSGKIFSAAEARAWAVKQGIGQPGPGRLSAAIRDAYAATH